MEPFDTFITDMTHKAFKLASTSLHKQKQRPHFSKSYFAILVIDMWLKRSKPKKHIFLWIITNWGSPGWPQCSVAWRDTLLLLWPVWRVLVARVWRVTCDVWRVTGCTLLRHKQVTVPSVCSPRWIFKRRFPKITQRFHGGLLLDENAVFSIVSS